MHNEIKGLIFGTALWIVGLFGMLIFWMAAWWIPVAFATVMLIGFAINIVLFWQFRAPMLGMLLEYVIYLWRTEYGKTK